ncbi:unnamed protein product [Didymodactylos carnosus]|uniref:Uncharacterized protein n=1 Tax=Didymodactylos carnosus TaxID=1234261 RepID=A0A814G277_9BILA|nr:unnamed protein product [Didymodactylos carnosus]CAF1280705.1 unnamed protein product [Didymodactylos carnosus]CAF3762679.1 unnamed protein product [Didymodactylos carnosus]CAF4085545.1 unnamed protein product [Didymodactylos carnosus]
MEIITLLKVSSGENDAYGLQTSHMLDFIETLSKKIPCDFERLDGYLIPAKEEHKTKVIDKELVAAKKAGMDVELINSTDKLPRYPKEYPTPHWLKFRNQGRLGFGSTTYKNGTYETSI